MSYLYDVCKRIAFRRIPPPGAEVCNCYIVGYMKKLLFLSFFGLFLLACTTDEGDGAPFVTDVVMPPSSQLFAPGDEVTVAARIAADRVAPVAGGSPGRICRRCLGRRDGTYRIGHHVPGPRRLPRLYDRGEALPPRQGHDAG